MTAAPKLKIIVRLNEPHGHAAISIAAASQKPLREPLGARSALTHPNHAKPEIAQSAATCRT
jgi:hypothetical protein